MREGSRPVRKLHAEAVRRVRASYQARAAEALSSLLTEEEADILRRGRNSAPNTMPKNADSSEYHLATGLEALFGFLRLTGQENRVLALFDTIWVNVE